MAYEYDLFVSYRRSPCIGMWVRNHLVPRLEARINEISPRQVKLSFDMDMEAGVRWPDDLKRRLRRSGLLVSVWSADYFRSPWCMAEWRSFLAREASLGLRTEAHPQGLVYPIRYADGKHFHPDANVTQCNKDFSKLNYPETTFAETARYIEFDALVQSMAEELVDRIEKIPPWSADFPVVEPAPMKPVNMDLPEI